MSIARNGKREMLFDWYRGEQYMGEGTIRQMALKQKVSYSRMCWLCTPSAHKVTPDDKQWYKFPVDKNIHAVYSVYKGDTEIASGTAQEIADRLGVAKKRVYHWATSSTHERDKGNRIISVRIDTDSH